jgi:hypothetical protein
VLPAPASSLAGLACPLDHSHPQRGLRDSRICIPLPSPGIDHESGHFRCAEMTWSTHQTGALASRTSMATKLLSVEFADAEQVLGQAAR